MTGRQALRRGLVRLAVESALVGAVVGALEGGRVAWLGAGLEASAIVGGCAAAAAIGIAAVVLAGLAAASRSPWLVRWRQASMTDRARLAWRAGLAASSAAALAVATYWAAGRLHVRFRFNDAGPFGLLMAGAVVAEVVVIGVGAALADATVTRWLARRRANGRRAATSVGAAAPGASATEPAATGPAAPAVATNPAANTASSAVADAAGASAATAATSAQGRALAALPPRWRDASWAMATAIAVAVLPPAVVSSTVPALNLAPVATFSILVALALIAHRWTLGEHPLARWLALGAVLACGAGVAASTRSEAARGRAIGNGVLSRIALRQLWALADRDGDHYASRAFGGADCDDHDAARSPAAVELAGDGIDNNCSGDDGDPAALRHRFDASPALAPSAPAALLPPPAPVAPRLNVVVVSIDALRADHLGAWGYPRPTSPQLDALAARSARFAWAMTACPSTRCAIPALLTGRYASTLRRQPAPVPTLAGELRAAGWETAAISCCDRFADSLQEMFGFDTIDTSADALRLRRAGQANADAVVDRVEQWLQRHGRPTAQTAATGAGSPAAGASAAGSPAAGSPASPAPPFFLWVHLYDPHHPYQAPEEPERFGDRDLDRYDAEIRFADRQVGRLLAELERLDLASTTIVVVTADHGDEFGEHGIRFHARSMFNQVVRIPLIVHLPTPGASNDAPGRVVDTPVSLVDVMPTVLELVGVPVVSGLNGRSLAAALTGRGPAPDRPVLIELVPDHQIARDMAAIAWGPWKVIWDREANAWSLFSLSRDPADAHDLVEDDAGILVELKRRLRVSLDVELGAPASAPTR